MVLREHDREQDEQGESCDDVALRLFGDDTLRQDALVAHGRRGFAIEVRPAPRILRDSVFPLARCLLFACAVEAELVFADLEVAVIDHSGDDIGAVQQLEGDQVGLLVFQLVDGKFL